MNNIKHVGRLTSNKRKLFVAYRTIPNDPYHCLVIFTDTLPSDDHDAIIRVLESSAGQQAYELAEALHRSFLPDGRNMLYGLHKTGRLQKISTADVEMTPTINDSVLLSQLNEIIAKNQGVSLEDLSLKSTSSNTANTETVTPTTNEVIEPVIEPTAPQPLSDEDLAKQLRSQADAMFKEAQRLRKEAEELAPAKKRTTTAKKPKAKTEESA